MAKLVEQYSPSRGNVQEGTGGFGAAAEVESAVPDEYVVGRYSRFMIGDVTVELPKGKIIDDVRLIAAARAAGVPLIPVGEAKDHVVCPNCSTVISLDNEQATVYAGLNRAQLSMITNRPRR
jgi:hypothetical protein